MPYKLRLFSIQPRRVNIRVHWVLLTLLLLLCNSSLFTNAYKNFHGLTYEQRTRCIGDSALCHLNKIKVDVFVVGDTGGISFDITHAIGTYTSTKAQRRLAASMAEMAGQYRPDFFLTLGDNIYWNGVETPGDPRFETLFEEPYIDGRLMMPWYMIAGNHDHLGNIQAQIDYSRNNGKWTFPSLYYKASYAFANSTRRVDFLFVDTIVMCGLTVDPDSRSVATWLWEALTNRRTLDGPLPRHAAEAQRQWRWLEDQLRTSSADYIFVAGHYPIHSVASHGPTKCLRDRLDPLMRRYRVSAYIAGHDHALQFFREDRFDNATGANSTMHYIVSGLGSRLDPSEDHLTEEQARYLLYRYPKYEDIPWLKRTMRTYLLGRGHGGFVRMEIRADAAELFFHADKGAPLAFRARIPPRKRV